MPSTYTPNRNYELQATGENTDTWGSLLNANALTTIDLNLGGRLAKSVAGSSNVTATDAEARNLLHVLSGTLTGNIDYILPDRGAFHLIRNSTSGSFTVTVKPSGGTGIVVPQGQTYLLFMNPTTGAAEHFGQWLLPGVSQTLTVGFPVTPYSMGTGSGTETPDPADGNLQYLTNNGAFTLAAPGSDCSIAILVTNGASDGNITFSGFTVGDPGDTRPTGTGDKYIIYITRINSVATYFLKALQ